MKMAEKATIVSWGGVVSNPRDGIGPPMGSGHYSSELEGKAAFVKNIEIFDSNGGSIDLANIAKSDVNREDCYNVYPELYHDNKLHFFTYWTRDDYNSTGCYNLDCEGFVMVNWDILTPGSVVNPVSIYDGQQYYITLSIKKDAKSGDWFLYREDIGDAKLIGYWPKSLFTTLADSANKISWGGVVIYDKNDTGPPMGSGHYASELERKAAYFKNLEMFDHDGNSHDLFDGAQARYDDKEACYTLSALVNSGKFGLHDGHLFYFGGPGGCYN
ncbi:uncharacterized protein LOC109727897 [Ananas comosus]|uniref:Uncharacterized protein LOC109727897 n=1 Tax=Ananas comosus TaxID=4615 RepID=A0A6P5HBX6_ANACO|nr:uncharacterized protein LOC109727897 [Ananas comosus]